MPALKKHLLQLTAGALAILFVFGTVNAQSLEQKLNTIKHEAATKQAQIQNAKQKEQTISEQMRTLSENAASARAAYDETKKQLDTTKAQIDKNEKLLQNTQENLKKRKKILDERVRYIYMHGQISYVDVIAGANSFSDFLARLDLIKRIIQYDYNLIHTVLDEQKTILKTQKSLEADRAKREKLAYEAKQKYDLLQEQQQQKKALLDKIKSDRATAERAYSELLAASKQVQELILNYNSSNYSSASVSGSGQMIWPISGPITSPFGWRMHPIYGRRIFHSGIDIGGEYGLPIHAAASGTVIYAGWISGYGNAVIISHGGGLETLYGHNESLCVSRGQHVAQGQVIAHCGSTGNSTGPHCHFEVRRNGSPVNPLNYL